MAKDDLQQPKSSIELGRQVLNQSLSEERSLAVLAQGLSNAYRSLLLSLAEILGATSVRVIMSRAVQKSAQSYPFLGDIAIYEDDLDPGLVLSHKSDADYAQVRESFESIFGEFIGLLQQLTGDEITNELMQRVLARKSSEESGGS